MLEGSIVGLLISRRDLQLRKWLGAEDLAEGLGVKRSEKEEVYIGKQR